MSSSDSKLVKAAASSSSAKSAPVAESLSTATLRREARRKPAPRASALGFKHIYHPAKATSDAIHAGLPSAPNASSSSSPSSAAVESNLLVLLHGLGDTCVPFGKLGEQLQRTLPQTAVLSLQGQARVPYMLDESCAWWESFDQLGELLPNPNPTKFQEAFGGALDYLVASPPVGCGWPATAIHVLGFGQGGTAALEGVVAWARSQRLRRAHASAPEQQPPDPSDVGGAGEARSGGDGAHAASRELGSVVSVCAGMLSHPTFSPPLSTPVLLFHRTPPSRADSPHLASLRRAFAHVEEHRAAGAANAASAAVASSTSSEGEQRMPAPNEWGAVMRFWSKSGRWRNRTRWEVEAAEAAGESGAGYTHAGGRTEGGGDEAEVLEVQGSDSSAAAQRLRERVERQGTTASGAPS